jgi:hypothetical protein
MNLFITYNSSPIQHSKVLRFNLEGGKVRLTGGAYML